MKKLFVILAIGGAFAISSCTKHACPAYGATQNVVSQPVHQSV